MFLIKNHTKISLFGRKIINNENRQRGETSFTTNISQITIFFGFYMIQSKIFPLSILLLLWSSSSQ